VVLILLNINEENMKIVPLVGYTNKLSGRPGDQIDFQISSQSKSPIKAQLFRSINADPNPKGAGIIEESCENFFPTQIFAGRNQSFFPGSYGKTSHAVTVTAKNELRVILLVCPTLYCVHNQTLLGIGETELLMNPDGCAELHSGDNVVSAPKPLSLNHWYRIEGHIGIGGQLRISVALLQHGVETQKVVTESSNLIVSPGLDLMEIVSVGARVSSLSAGQFFNGKIEAPQILADKKCVAQWNFSTDITALSVLGDNCPDLDLFNSPTRGVKGALWDGSEQNWRHKPDHYGAIHFHEDDIYDFGWETDFSFKIPTTMPSGIYVMRISSDLCEDAMPFFVCPPLGKPTAKLCVLVSTFTYTIYGNYARPDYHASWQGRIKEWGAYPHNPAEFPDYGLSTYNLHSDGSGICHASHKRPLFNIRPGYLTFGETDCSGLRHFQADSHLIAWLHAKGIHYDIVTDEELHNDGITAIKDYASVTTGSHPEYHTSQMLDALIAYRDGGGSLLYLGGNGFYWKIVRHSDDPDLLEIRRAEDGLRAWASEPGEYYNAFDGSYGGLWRRNGRPPQKLVGVGFTAQGTFVGMPYNRVCHDPKFSWVFEGIEGDVVGDFGFSGNGAAGYELDRIDPALSDYLNLAEGTEITVLAQSYDIANDFMLVPEEQLTHLANLSGGPEAQAKRADMIYFTTEDGGQVFSVGSITFCGSLPWNNYENNVSKLLSNVLIRFIGPS
jgi:N,N-dimethylformamidase